MAFVMNNKFDRAGLDNILGQQVNPATEDTLLLLNSGSNSLYSTRIDEASATVNYFGFAAAGSAEGSAVWRIKRLTVTGTVTDIKFADGDTNFDNIWTNRAALTYT